MTRTATDGIISYSRGLHPSRSNRPSHEDLNRGLYDSVSIIIGVPYEDDTRAA